MNNVSSNAQSGLAAARLRLDIAAHNIANRQTQEPARQTVSQEALPDSGVAASVAKSDQLGDQLASDMVAQMEATYAFKANVRTLQAQREMVGSLLDVKA